MMTTIVDMISGNFTELLRVMWMEVAIACLAATVYFSFTGLFVNTTKKGKCKIPNDAQKKLSPRSRGQAGDHEPTTHQLVAKALRQGKISEAVALLQNLSEVKAGYVPVNIAPRLLMAAAKTENFEDAMKEVSIFAEKIETRSLDAVVLEAAKHKDVAACRQLQVIAGLLSIPKSTQTLEALAKVHASDASCLRALIEDTEAPLPRPFAKAVLEACITLKDVDLAAEVFEKVADCDAPVLRAVVEKAASGATAGAAPESMSESAWQCKEIRACGKNGDLSGAMQIFEHERKHNMNARMYNSIMDACVESGSFEKAMEFFKEAKSSGLADIISYNTAMKCYLAQGQVAAAKDIFAEISQNGLTPTLASYHGLLNFYVTAQDHDSTWTVVADMQAAGVIPSAVTCSILLKGKLESTADLRKVLALVDSLDPIDEVLFHTIAESCIRLGQLHLLAKYQVKLQSQGNSPVLAAPTYGAMMKAHGKARDVKRVKELWAEMAHLGVQPTAITLGCMVEALVSNRCTSDAWKLAQQMRSNESTRPLVNTVIYSTILKGFSNAKETEKVMALYEEMKSNDIQPNNVTYNTILNAFATGGAMHRVPALLEDMKTAVPPAEPDIVTYSTIVKGFCNSGSLDRALEILKDVQADGKFTPDEVMYNSLLDGCAKEHRLNDALKLVDEMKKTGVVPSNYTLSMLVKLMGRCRKLNQCFSMIEEICREYGLKLNIQVYTCMIQACFNNRQATKAVALHEKMIEEGLSPDEMTYSALVKGCLQAGLVDKAVELTKCAHGLGMPKGRGSSPGINARCRDELASMLGDVQAKALWAELAEKAPASKGQGKGSWKGSGGSNPPWRQQK